MPDCPVIDYSNRIIKQPDCNQSNGSITGIIVTSSSGKVTYVWHDEDGKVVGHSADLLNIPAGTYTLVVTNTGCTALISTPPFVVDNVNGITLDDSKIAVKNSSCKNDGSITGITAVNATLYTWVNTISNTTVSASATTADINNLAPGTYQLTASNSSCEEVRKYSIGSSIITPTIVSHTVTDGQCGEPGTLSVTLSVSAQQPRLTTSIQNELGVEVYNGIVEGDIPHPTISIGADPGTYSFYVYDAKGCGVLLGTYAVKSLPITFINTIIKDDHCDQQMGAIIPTISGYTPVKDGQSYTWINVATGEVVGKGFTLSGVGAGTYQITMTTLQSFCNATAVYTIKNISPPLPPPIAKGTTICTPGMINIAITNVDTSKLFRLYDSPTATTAIDSSTNGIFYRNVDQTTDFYVTRVSNECESERTKVTEIVVASFKRPNAFTPNGDGINDFWNLEGVDKFPGADIEIFTRSGQMIYHSVNYAVPFDGTYNGRKLPAGVYYYIINLKQPICYGKISGSLTIIR